MKVFNDVCHRGMQVHKRLYLVWSIHSSQDFGISLLKICAAIGLVENSQLAANLSQFIGTTTVHSQSILRQKLKACHSTKEKMP